MKDSRKIFGKRLRNARKRKHITQKELGDRLGVKRLTIYRYETGKADSVPFETLNNISKELDISLTELFEDTF